MLSAGLRHQVPACGRRGRACSTLPPNWWTRHRAIGFASAARRQSRVCNALGMATPWRRRAEPRAASMVVGSIATWDYLDAWIRPQSSVSTDASATEPHPARAVTISAVIGFGAEGAVTITVERTARLDLLDPLAAPIEDGSIEQDRGSFDAMFGFGVLGASSIDRGLRRSASAPTCSRFSPHWAVPPSRIRLRPHCASAMCLLVPLGISQGWLYAQWPPWPGCRWRPPPSRATTG